MWFRFGAVSFRRTLQSSAGAPPADSPCGRLACMTSCAGGVRARRPRGLPTGGAPAPLPARELRLETRKKVCAPTLFLPSPALSEIPIGQRPQTYQPKATPWVTVQKMRTALKGRCKISPRSCYALSGLFRVCVGTQGVALGLHVLGLWPIRNAARSTIAARRT